MHPEPLNLSCAPCILILVNCPTFIVHSVNTPFPGNKSWTLLGTESVVRCPSPAMLSCITKVQPTVLQGAVATAVATFCVQVAPEKLAAYTVEPISVSRILKFVFMAASQLGAPCAGSISARFGVIVCAKAEPRNNMRVERSFFIRKLRNNYP